MTTPVRVPELSAQHAAIIWTGQRWLLRDLASRNGTYLNGERLPSGGQIELYPGGVIALGSPDHTWTVVELSPPVPRAFAPGRSVSGEPGILAIPDADDPQALILLDESDRWILSAADTRQPVASEDQIVVAGERWTLDLPEDVPQTLESSRPLAIPQGAALSFRVSADDEYVEIDATIDGTRHRLKPRAYHYLLLTLARSRMQESIEASSSDSEHGWLYTDDLRKMLGITSNQLYVSMHRARKELEALGLPEETPAIERRSTTHQVRIGIARLEVGPI